MDAKKPVSNGEIPTDPPPDYETAALQHNAHNALPARSSPAQRKPLPPPPQLDLPILKYMRTHRVVLASASPRRKALLAQIGLPNVEVIPSTKPENLSKVSMGGYEYVSATAQQKAMDVYSGLIAGNISSATTTTTTGGGKGGEDMRRRSSQPLQQGGGGGGEKDPDPDLVISADTVILTRTGSILEKPSSEASHRAMLRHLRDSRVHRVLTAVCCVAPRADASHPGYEMATHVEETKVFFAREDDGLPDDVIDSYVRTREGVDKAGGYAVQGLGGMLLVEKVEGAVDNVVGLPVRKLLQLCEKVVFKQDGGSEDEDEEE